MHPQHKKPWNARWCLKLEGGQMGVWVERAFVEPVMELYDIICRARTPTTFSLRNAEEAYVRCMAVPGCPRVSQAEARPCHEMTS
ncbi:hypothetical protein DPEC_G00090320 [Dallia pectoralis]|uniref:Uncharacterized protein n=1 Tax=Dallia pectoralis TaxID=75939 RepID=A0ACC2H188_DALPE|nr:hypothetical protein DPEC_G00090320 [Dallia pectoralis]